MFISEANDIVFILASSLTILGVISIGAGIVVLVTRVTGKAVNSIAAQTARLAQKGITEEIAGLVGNASSLMDAINQLVRTSAGIGIFLVLFGFVMLVAAFAMIKAF
ncbi:MAG: hypothetical protein EHM21_16120 [Chloroflexi bacterium]|nr:MAG: hypothetical protein EHM21_16120 [Chloroflexota bacterium]